MISRIELINEKKLVGKQMIMCYADYRIGELWASFMPRRNEIQNKLSDELISLVVYSSTHFVDFKPTNEFERWATVEVEIFDNVPNEMETYILPGGLYAVFIYKGLITGISSFYQIIFNIWLPNSNYILDDIALFVVL